MKDTNLKLEKASKSKVTPKVNTNNKFNQKGNNKKSPKQDNDDKYTYKKVPPKKIEN